MVWILQVDTACGTKFLMDLMDFQWNLPNKKAEGEMMYFLLQHFGSFFFRSVDIQDIHELPCSILSGESIYM